LIEIGAISANGVDFRSRVVATNEAVGTAPIARQADGNDISFLLGPFALNAKEPTGNASDVPRLQRKP
jgi:hypothetical protein